LGVASGDPDDESVVLWTRLAPDPLGLGGGMTVAPRSVEWEVAEDDGMRRVVRRGAVVARAESAHSVHVLARGLRPGRWYWYRFRSEGAESPVGRTRTLPARGLPNDKLRLAVASCQHYETGYYAAYGHMARAETDLVAFLGDYIYESTQPGRLRQHGSGEPETLEEYRRRYALYKSDAQLQAAHASAPWVVTWDDHEVDNNYAGRVPEDATPIARFVARREAAYRAFYEHMPVRRRAGPDDTTLHRTVAFGDLAQLHVLDTRQFRDDQSCGDGRKPPCPEWSRPERSILGPGQERWLHRELTASRARWNVLAQQVVMAPLDVDPSPEGVLLNMDSWNGYPAARNRLFGLIAERRVPNVVTLTGDIHASFASEMPRDTHTGRGPTVGVEYVCTSISSDGDGVDQLPQLAAVLPVNPWMKFHNARRGYLRCEITRDQWQSDFLVLPHVRSTDAPISVAASFVTPAGSGRVERAG
jgi:alkaline phosphatase D